MSVRGWVLIGAMSIIWGIPYLLIKVAVEGVSVPGLPSTHVVAALAAPAVICTTLAVIVFFALIREVGAARALVFTYGNPAVALAAGVIVLGEPLTAYNIGGLGLILAGLVLPTRKAAQTGRERENLGEKSGGGLSQPVHTRGPA